LLCLAGAAAAQVCPEGMEFVPGGTTQVVYSGERWGGTVYEEQSVDDFCIDKYEASQPDATATYDGSWTGNGPPPPAQSQVGVLPWTCISWERIKEACAAAGKRMPTLAEWQTAYSGYDGAFWPWGGDDYDQVQAADCHINVTEPPAHSSFPTGGCCFENCQGDRCFTPCDMLGNVAEFVDGYWDESCFGQDQILVAGGALMGWQDPNSQVEILTEAGCWHWRFYAQTRYGLHHHHSYDGYLVDDGFRCALSVADDDAAPDDDAASDDDTIADDDLDDDATDDEVDDDSGAEDDAGSGDAAAGDDAGSCGC
jgi:formylglycine-generating enzyme required for sulfatase activity